MDGGCLVDGVSLRCLGHGWRAQASAGLVADTRCVLPKHLDLCEIGFYCSPIRTAAACKVDAVTRLQHVEVFTLYHGMPKPTPVPETRKLRSLLGPHI